MSQHHIEELLLPMAWNVQPLQGLCNRIQKLKSDNFSYLFQFIVDGYRKMLDIGGSVADAAIAGLLCEGVASPQSTGLGGGFVMTIFDKKNDKVKTLIARDVAPLAATEDMFVNRTVTGGLAVSVPGELKGYWELHKQYGLLNWSQLFDPVIELCRKGHIVSPYLANILRTKEKVIRNSKTLSEIYINPDTNEVYQAGDLVKRHKLADTLEIIKNEGVNTMYSRNGTIAKLIVQDIKDAGGIVTIEDLLQYDVRWKNPISISVKDKKTIHTLPLPGSGPLVAFIMNVLNEYLDSEISVLALHRMTEALKFAYAKRTELGDDEFVDSAIQIVQNLTNYDFAMGIRSQIDDFRTFNDYKHYGANFSSEDDHGTSHINIIAPNGDAIAATGTINTM